MTLLFLKSSQNLLSKNNTSDNDLYHKRGPDKEFTKITKSSTALPKHPHFHLMPTKAQKNHNQRTVLNLFCIMAKLKFKSDIGEGREETPKLAMPKKV